MPTLNPFYLFLAGNFPLSAELQCFWMAFQGSMAVRNGKNHNLKMNWFHAFCLSVMSGYAGATFTALWMGRPTSMLSNDLNMAFCIIAFAIVNYLPYDIGYRIGNTMPVVIVTTVFAQLFRAMGLVKFSQIAYEAFKDSPSPYYPTPIFGPILLPTLLGNFGGFFAKGFDGHLGKGMPWPFQNGLFCATFYHFFVHDEDGFIGVGLRKILGGLPKIFGVEDEHTFAVICISLFMQVVPLLQLKYFLGPSFSPFNFMSPLASSIGRTVHVPLAGKKSVSASAAVSNGPITATPKKRKRRVKKKNNTGASTGTSGEKEKEL